MIEAPLHVSTTPSELAVSMGGVKVEYDARHATVSMSIENGVAVFSIKAFGIFLHMVQAYVAGPHEIVKDEQELSEIPEHPEGPCPQCHESKILASNVMRKCKGCDYVWRVPLQNAAPE